MGQRDELHPQPAPLEAEEEIVALRATLGMAEGCLKLIQEWLAGKGIDLTHTPPMLYAEACQSVLFRETAKLRQLVEENYAAYEEWKERAEQAQQAHQDLLRTWTLYGEISASLAALDSRSTTEG